MGERGEICDTPFSSWEPDSNLMEVDEIVAVVRNNIESMKHVVITGGEPMLQEEPLVFLCKKLKEMDLHITLETNGTMYTEAIAEVIDLYSLSPKLSNSIPWLPHLRETGYEYSERRALRHNKVRKNIKVLQAFINYCYHTKPGKGANVHGPFTYTETDFKNRKTDKDFQLKFVVSHSTDIDEIKTEFLHYLKGVESNDVILMPLGSNRDGLDQTAKIAMSESVKNGWRYTPRLHVDLFNNKRSV